MHLDYRFYVKFGEYDLWDSCMNRIAIETADGEEYSLAEIARVFRSPGMFMTHLSQKDSIADIFDDIKMDGEALTCQIHDHCKSFDFFVGLTEYMMREIARACGDNAAAIADITNFDNDSFGDHIFYYLGGENGIGQYVVEGPAGLEHHDVEISDFASMLPLSSEQQKALERFISKSNSSV